MKKIKFTCSSCQAKLRVPSHFAGVTAPCPKCGEKITAPADFEESEEDTAAIPAPMASSAGNGSSGPNPAERGIPAPSSATTVAPATESYSPPAPSAVAAVSAPAVAVANGTVQATGESYAQENQQGQTALAKPEIRQETPAYSAPAAEPPLAPAPAPEPTPSPEPAPVVAPEPVVQKTQPIRVNPQPRNLPGMRNDAPRDESADLPRLDTSIAENGDVVAPMETPREPTRVQLPEPGAYSNQVSPDDFIVPNTPAAEVSAEPEAAPPAEPVSEIPSAPAPTEAHTPQEPAHETEMSVSEMLGLDGFEPEPTAPVSPAQVDPQVMPPVAEQPIESTLQDSIDYRDPAHPDYAPDPVAPSEPVLPVPLTMPGQNGVEAGAGNASPAEEVLSYEQPLTETPQEAPLEYYEEPSYVPAEEPQNPAAVTNPIAASTNAAAPAAIAEPTGPAVPEKSDADVLDDMFGSSDSGGGMSRGVMLAVIACVVVVATIVVVAIVNAAGGLSVDYPNSSNDLTASATAPPPVAPEKPDTVLNPGSEAPGIDDAPAIIDPPALTREPEPETSGPRSTVTLPGDTDNPVLIVDNSSPAISDPVNEVAESVEAVGNSVAAGLNNLAETAESEAISFDEKVQQIVNGGSTGDSDPGGMSVIGGAPSQNLVDGVGNAAAEFGSALSGTAADAKNLLGEAGEAAVAAVPGAVANYNPAPAYPAPKGEEDLTTNTHAIIDAFLRAPDWQTRVRYTHNGDSLSPAIEDYYKKWPYNRIDQFSTQLYDMESDPELGGPYWMYLISKDDTDQGFPLIIREENGNLKVDWEIFTEFHDRHFVRFRKGAIGGTSTFRLVIERMSDYYGSDRDGFTDLDDYLVYQINPPYGDLNEFSEYAFVKKGTPVAEKLDEVAGLGEIPLAVIVTLREQSFAHGIKHYVISDYVTEGWFLSE